MFDLIAIIMERGFTLTFEPDLEWGTAGTRCDIESNDGKTRVVYSAKNPKEAFGMIVGFVLKNHMKGNSTTK